MRSLVAEAKVLAKVKVVQEQFVFHASSVHRDDVSWQGRSFQQWKEIGSEASPGVIEKRQIFVKAFFCLCGCGQSLILPR